MTHFFSYLIPSYKDYWRRANDFKGRTSRIEFWAVTTAAAIATFLLYIIGKIINNPTEIDGDVTVFINLAWALANIIPGVAIGVRRMRDALENPGVWIWLPVATFLLRTYRQTLEGDFRLKLTILTLGMGLLELWFQCKPSHDRRKITKS